jgi:uridine kinase
MLAYVLLLQAGRSVEVPVYDFTRHARSEEVRKVRQQQQQQRRGQQVPAAAAGNI